MNRTVRAALLAAVIAFVAVAGLGVFLVPGATTGSVVAGLVAAALAGGLLLAASRRAESFHAPSEHDEPPT